MVSTGISAYCRKPAGPPAAPEKQEKLPPGHGVSRADVYFVFAAVPESGQRNLLDLDGLFWIVGETCLLELQGFGLARISNRY